MQISFLLYLHWTQLTENHTEVRGIQKDFGHLDLPYRNDLSHVFITVLH